MNSTCGENLNLTIFGASHDPEIGMTLTGVPAGEEIDLLKLQQFLSRRAPGRNAYSTSRKEADLPEFRSGLTGNVTDGNPITAVIRNTNAHSSDYEKLKYVPRPGHADFTAALKYFGTLDMAGGGPFSGRMTAPLCIAGGILMQLLEKQGITVAARIRSIAGIVDHGELTEECSDAGIQKEGVSAPDSGLPLSKKDFPVLDDAQGEKMKEAILNAKAEGDSVGGIVECAVFGLPGGLGGPLFDGMEGQIAKIVFGIPAVKGVEFGEGFGAAALKGSKNNDPFIAENGQVLTETNHAGGILGGITNGMPLVFRAAFKPTPSIAKAQKSVDLRTLEPVTLEIEGRHDPCIVPRAVPVVEAAAAIAVYGALLGRQAQIRTYKEHFERLEKA